MSSADRNVSDAERFLSMDGRPSDSMEPRVSGDRLLDGGFIDDEVGIEGVGLESKSSWYLFLLTLSIGG